MKLLNTILDKIFGKPVATINDQVTPNNTAPANESHAPTAGLPINKIDVNKVLNDLASKSKEKLNWKESIVDLMKLVGMDSSISARKELATELSYKGDMNDSAAMNIWLHKQVMLKLAENGGVVPKEFLD